MWEIGIIPALGDAPLRDAGDRPLGAVEDLLADRATNRPAWLVVRLDDGRRTVVPWRGSRPGPGGTRVPWDAETVRACPVTLGGPALEPGQVLPACRHYGLALPPGEAVGRLTATLMPLAA